MTYDINVILIYNNKICNECINNTVNANDVQNAINKLKPGKTMDLMALHLIILLMHLLWALCIYHTYLLPCYIIVLPQNPYVIPLCSPYQNVQTKIHLISIITEV